jgi:hypothetical protein
MDAYRRAVEAADREETGETDDLPRVFQVDSAIQPEDTAPRRHGARPPLRRGQPIDAYTRGQLVQLVRWIESDDQVRTQDELVLETMRELGFQKRGRKIVAAIEGAIRQARF